MLAFHQDTFLEMFMRYSPVALTLALALACVSSGVLAQKPDNQISPQSLALTRAGEAALAAKDYQKAIDSLESALAVDPRNRQAFVTLGKVAQAEGLPGKAIGFYGQALGLEPNDLAALEAQGEAMVQRGAVKRAEANLQRIRTLCNKECSQAKQLSAVIAKGPPPQVVTAQSATVVPPAPKDKPEKN